jgi:DNA invertase Pin-like site-specific DNA recombinase
MKPQTVQPNKAVLYARVSSKEQEREGYSIPAQCKLLRSYAERHSYNIIHEFIDVETAKQSGRALFTDMIRFLEEHPEVRTVLCEKTDRLYRNFRDYVTIDDLDLTLIFVKEGSILNKGSRSHEKFIHGIKVLMAKNYIDNLSEETRKGLLEKAEEGKFPGTAPLGYLHDTVNKTIVADPDRAPAIWELFNLYATGDYSIRRLHVHAASVGLTSRKGNRISRSSISVLLKNPFYTGVFVWNGKHYQGKHPPIVTKELFNKVQAVIAQRNDTRSVSHCFAYTGLLKCSHCGSGITAEIKKEQYIYYHCTFDKGKCGAAYVREEELERQFEEILTDFSFSPEVLEWMREALRQSAQEKKAFTDRALEKLSAENLKLKNRIDQMYLDKLDGEIDETFYWEHVSQWREEQETILDRMKRHQNADQNYIEQGIRLLEVARNAPEFFRKHGQEERAQLLQFILHGSTLEKDKILPVFRPPFDIIHALAADARQIPPSTDIKKQAASNETACPAFLPRTDSNCRLGG